MATPSFTAALAELGAGSLESQLSAALATVARALKDLDTKTKGRVTLDLKLERAKGTGQLLVTHALTYIQPTSTGRITETATDDTMVYVGRDGAISVIPESQGKFDFAPKEGTA